MESSNKGVITEMNNSLALFAGNPVAVRVAFCCNVAESLLLILLSVP